MKSNESDELFIPSLIKKFVLLLGEIIVSAHPCMSLIPIKSFGKPLITNSLHVPSFGLKSKNLWTIADKRKSLCLREHNGSKHVIG